MSLMSIIHYDYLKGLKSQTHFISSRILADVPLLDLGLKLHAGALLHSALALSLRSEVFTGENAFLKFHFTASYCTGAAHIQRVIYCTLFIYTCDICDFKGILHVSLTESLKCYSYWFFDSLIGLLTCKFLNWIAPWQSLTDSNHLLPH